MPSAFGFAAYLIQDLGLNEEAVLHNLEEYLLKEGLCIQEIYTAQQAYNADPVFYSDPMPSHPNVISQTTVEDATNTTQDSLVYNNSTFTTTSTDIHSSDRVHDTQDNLEQDTFYEHPTGYYSAALSPATIDPHVLDPQAGHMDSLPHTNIYDPAYGLAASLIAHVSESQDNTPGKVNHVTQAVVQHPAKLLPVATMKTTGRIVRASTLHFHQLVTDKHFQIDDELHVPLEVIRRADGSREPARDVVAVMMFKGRGDGPNLSKWVVSCSAIGGNGWLLEGSGPTDFRGKLNEMGMIGSAGHNWSGVVRVVRNGQDLGTVTEFKSSCFS